MEEFVPLVGGQWVGFATRTIPMHWLKYLGIGCAAFSALPLMIGGFPLLNSTRDPDYDMEVIAVFGGLGLLVVGLLMLVSDTLRQKRELERGELKAKGVFWNPETKVALEGLFHFNIDSGSTMPGDPNGFKHLCSSVQRGATRSTQASNPVLKMVFTVRGGLTKGEFAGSTFTSRSFSDLDAIILTNGSIARVSGKKANPCWLCSEVGAQLQQVGQGVIGVEVIVDSDWKSAVATRSSNAGVTGAALGGIVGAAIGSTIEDKREQQRARELASYQAEVRRLFESLQKTAEKFGWTSKIAGRA